MENNDNKTGRLISFRVSEREDRMLNSLVENLGAKRSELLRSMIRKDFLKLFSPYMLKKHGAHDTVDMLEDELTQEQICEKVGGKVESVNGIPTCVIPISKAFTRKVTLSLMGRGEFTIEKLKRK